MEIYNWQNLQHLADIKAFLVAGQGRSTSYQVNILIASRYAVFLSVPGLPPDEVYFVFHGIHPVELRFALNL
jgi:hypothetical protein